MAHIFGTERQSFSSLLRTMIRLVRYFYYVDESQRTDFHEDIFIPFLDYVGTKPYSNQSYLSYNAAILIDNWLLGDEGLFKRFFCRMIFFQSVESILQECLFLADVFNSLEFGWSQRVLKSVIKRVLESRKIEIGLFGRQFMFWKNLCSIIVFIDSSDHLWFLKKWLVRVL